MKKPVRLIVCVFSPDGSLLETMSLFPNENEGDDPNSNETDFAARIAGALSNRFKPNKEDEPYASRLHKSPD